MKAETEMCDYNFPNKWNVYINRGHGRTYLYKNVTRSRAVNVRDSFNSALASHVQSELSAKIEQIEKDLTDKKIRELNPIWVRDEIIKRLKSGH